jgi:hypothetical protein
MTRLSSLHLPACQIVDPRSADRKYAKKYCTELHVVVVCTFEIDDICVRPFNSEESDEQYCADK